MKRRTTLEAVLPDRDSSLPAYRWLYSTLRGQILDGRLRPGARLPASRDLAQQYGISRGTIVEAFEQLRAEGYVESRTGAGTFVTQALPDDAFDTQTSTRKGAGNQRRVSAFAQRVSRFPAYQDIATRAFRPNLPALDLFPAEQWSKIVSRRLRSGDASLYMGCEPEGYRPLREAVADYLNAARGVRCTADQVLIVSGVQEALDIAARVLIDPHDRACIESPGYEGARIAFRAVGAEIVDINVDREGMRVGDELGDARVVYVTPAHQFPLGVTMSITRRLALLKWARSTGATIFEDDYDSEFRYQGRPIQALQGLDEDARVIFGGSFSKVMFPSLRLGYVVVPEDLHDAFAAAKSMTTRHAQLLEQAALFDFIANGHFARHVRRMRDIYAERMNVLLDESRRLLAGALCVSPVEAGLQTVGWLDAGIDATALANAIQSDHVDLRPLGHSNEGCEALLLGFAAVDVNEIRRAVRVLASYVEFARR